MLWSTRRCSEAGCLLPVSESGISIMAAAAAQAPVSAEDVMRIQSSWSDVTAKFAVADVGVILFEMLFERNPQVLDLFPFKGPDGKPNMPGMKAHGTRVVRTLGTVVTGLQDLDATAGAVRALVERHRGYRVELAHYDVVLGVVRDTLANALGPAWTNDVAASWAALLGVIKAIAEDVYGH